MSNPSENHPVSVTDKNSAFSPVISAYKELEESILIALQTYSNVHRGKGHFSLVTTHLYEKARQIVLDYLELDKSEFELIFLSPLRADNLINKITGNYRKVSSSEIGLPIGIVALAVEKKSLPEGAPYDTGGGTTKLTSRNWIIWDNSPDKFEAGTPSVINIIAFAKALTLTKKYGKDIFLQKPEVLSSDELLKQNEYGEIEGKELLVQLQYDLIGKNVKVPTYQGELNFINMDNSASTPSFYAVWNTYRAVLRQPVDSINNIRQQVREICGSFLGLPSEDFEIIFTSNTTESVNLVAHNLLADRNYEPVIITSILEHSSNDLPWRFLPNAQVIRLEVDGNGFFDTNQLRSLLNDYNTRKIHGNKRIELVTLSGASNVLGICNNLSEIRSITRESGVRLHIDAAQLIAHKRIDYHKCDPDYLSFSAHKIYAPFGTGVLVVRKGLLNGINIESAINSGEENLAGIAALGKSLQLMNKVGMEVIEETEHEVTVKALYSLVSIKGMKIYGLKNTAHPDFIHKIGVIPFSLGNKVPHSVARQMALYGGIGVRSGCHCAHLIVKKLVGMTPFFENIQWMVQKLVPKVSFPGVVRISFGIGTTLEDIENLVKTLKAITANKNTLKRDSIKTENELQKFINRIERKVYSLE